MTIKSFRRAPGRVAAMVVLMAGAGAALPTVAAAQAALDKQIGPDKQIAQGEPGVQDIVVTARKITESTQNVPVSIVALGQAQLANNLVVDLANTAELAPQVIIGRSIAGTGAILSIRGISSAAADSGVEQSVEVEMDGVPLSRGRVVSAGLFDTRQVTVMEGPQALFFGKNSPAGVISITSTDPKDHLEGYVKAGYEFVAAERYTEGAISGPLVGALKARLAIRADEMDGWIKNVAGPVTDPFTGATMPGATNGSSSPGSSDLDGRLTLLWDPTSDFTAKFKVLLENQHLDSNGAFAEIFCLNPSGVPTQLGHPMPGASCEKNMTSAASALAPQFAVNYPYANGGVPYALSHLGLYSLELNKTLGKINITSNSGFYAQLVQGAHNGDFSPFVRIFSVEHENYRLFTQELRAATSFDGPLNFSAGGYYEHSTRNWLNAPDLYHYLNPVNGSYYTNLQTSDSHNDSYSGFGQVRWNILPTLELAGGARYSHDDKATTFINVVNNSASPFSATLRAQGLPLAAQYSANNTSPEATLTWKPDPDNTLYGAYKSGYKAGGISNAALLQASATPTSVLFGPEKAIGFEAGYKGRFFDRRLRVELTAYRYKYEGLQVTSLDPVLFLVRVNNAAAARTQGVQGIFDWMATDRLSLNGNFGYNDAHYLDFRNAPCYSGQVAATGCVGGVQDLSGRPLNRAPKLTFNIGGNYRVEMQKNWVVNLSASASHTGSYEAAADYSLGGMQDAFWRLNAAVRINPGTDRVEFALVGRNLTNSYYLSTVSTESATGRSDQYVGQFNRPREVVLEATAKF